MDPYKDNIKAIFVFFRILKKSNLEWNRSNTKFTFISKQKRVNAEIH